MQFLAASLLLAIALGPEKSVPLTLLDGTKTVVTLENGLEKDLQGVIYSCAEFRHPVNNQIYLACDGLANGKRVTFIIGSE